MIDARDKWSVIINLAGFIFYLFAIPLLITSLLADSTEYLLIGVQYSIVLLIFWPIQILYHYLITEQDEKDTLRRFDRSSMLWLIASMFTPLIWVYSFQTLAYISIITIWALATIGTGCLLRMKELPRKIAPIFGFLMGIIGMVFVSISIPSIPSSGIVLFVFGAFFLILGGSVYAIKKPDIKPGVFGFHEVYHTTNLIGCILLHFLVQMSLI